ncbi:MAG: hypothetical protein QG594_627, partial [Bacteroidota bacterium]|nr:hypothetical protein [Bacteroidota bacterium]
MKKCKDCGTDKPEAEFYGAQGECKSCTKERVRKREQELSKDPAWVEKERKRHRDKYYKLGYKDLNKPTPEQKKATMEKYKNKYPEKINAHLFLLGRKLKAKNTGSHLHHWSYNKEHWIDCIE